MFAESKMIHFRGFHPCEYTRSYIANLVDLLHGEAPHGSIIDATFSRNGKAIKGIVKINSSVGEFFAVASGEKLKNVSHKLTEQIRRQVSKWKSKKLNHETIKYLSIEVTGD